MLARHAFFSIELEKKPEITIDDILTLHNFNLGSQIGYAVQMTDLIMSGKSHFEMGFKLGLCLGLKNDI